MLSLRLSTVKVAWVLMALAWCSIALPALEVTPPLSPD